LCFLYIVEVLKMDEKKNARVGGFLGMDAAYLAAAAM
jgi:hypothetical protein